MPPSQDISPAEPVAVYSLEHEVWRALQADLVQTLERRGLSHLAAPTALVLHDLIDGAVSAMHHSVFTHIVASDFGLNRDGDDEHAEDLYRTETAEHGAENITRYCKANGSKVSVSFPGGDALVWLDVPVAWDASACGTARLIDALGYRLDAAPLPGKSVGQRLRLLQRPDPKALTRTSELLDPAEQTTSLANIFDQLDYGLIHFSSTGEIVSVSPSMLRRLRLEVAENSLTALEGVIPLNFYNDIIWSAALEGRHGVFENYRIRVKLANADNASMLFNVSGYRDEKAVVHSLWQAVSLDEGGALLSEGSILSEVRIHNITRNYVPQQVEEKARDAIRLGKTKLTNEVRKIAVLFCDIVGFTSYVEANAGSESVIDTLNSILRRVASTVKRNHGSIDKFMGDCVMALFDDPADSLAAACDMQGHSDDINTLRIRAGQQTLQLRIGVHWGEVVIGNVGTVERLDWTAIGDIVNTASRIEKGCRPGAILTSATLRDAVAAKDRPRFHFGDVFRLQVKGKWEELAVCEVTPA